MALTWADRRRAYLFGGVGAIGLMLVAAVAFSIMYEAPSCRDFTQNQDEAGVDCGGSCAYLCASQVQKLPPPEVRAISTASGRTDVVAYIENRNQGAEAKDAAFDVEVYSESGELLGKRSVRMDLPARTIVPVFVPGVVAGVTAAPKALVAFTDLKWRFARGEIEPVVIGRVDLADGLTPRVTAVVSNPSPAATHDRVLVASVYNSSGTIIAASQTVLSTIPALGERTAIFTWNAPFPEAAARVEVRAQPRLP